MSKHRILAKGLTAAASISMLAACSPTSTPTTPGTPSSSPTATATPVATPTPGETTSPAPTATPTPGQTASPTPSPSATATATASPSATATPSTPLASATSDISVVEKTTFNGKVYDDTNAPLDGVTVVAKSLNSTLPYDATTTTAGGAYAFNNAPAGVQLEITASKPGFTTRRRVEVLKSNKDGDPNANKYDFGSDSGTGSIGTALSDKPEVVTVTPGRNASGVNPATSFVMKFSEPMDRATVVDSLLIRAFSTETLSVDNLKTVDGATGGVVSATDGTQIWDKSAFNVSWNSDDSEATLTFKEERYLPTDKDTDKAPDYQVTFTKLGGSSNIKDKAGISRTSDFFKLTEGNFEASYKFTVAVDTTKPRVDSIVAQTAENSGASSEGDVIRVRFNERMIHYTLQRTIAGGINNVASQAPGAVTDSQSGDAISAFQAAANYVVTVSRNAAPVAGLNLVEWSALGGRAIYDTTDPTHKTILLLPGNTSATRSAGGALVSTDNITGTFYYTDGSSEAVTATFADDSAGVDAGTGISTNEIQFALNQLETGNNGFTVTAVNPATATADLANGSTYNMTLATGSTRAAGVHAGKTIRNVIFTGGTANTGVNAANPLQAYPGVGAGGRADIYVPGDNVMVEAKTTIVDPAGNTVDSAGDDASANAS